jgi:hypothetical protein
VQLARLWVEARSLELFEPPSHQWGSRQSPVSPSQQPIFSLHRGH